MVYTRAWLFFHSPSKQAVYTYLPRYQEMATKSRDPQPAANHARHRRHTAEFASIHHRSLVEVRSRWNRMLGRKPEAVSKRLKKPDATRAG